MSRNLFLIVGLWLLMCMPTWADVPQLMKPFGTPVDLPRTQQEYDTAKESFGETDPRTLNALQQLAEALYAQGKPEEALPHLMFIHDTLLASVPSTDLRIWANIARMGMTLSAMGHFTEAQDAFGTAMEIQAASPRHPLRIALYEQWGLLLEQSQQLEVAMMLYDMSTNLLASTEGKTSRAMRLFLARKGKMYLDSKEYPKAIAQLEEAADMWRKEGSLQDPLAIETLTTLGMAHIAQKSPRKAESVLLMALNASMQLYGPNRTETLRVLYPLMNLYRLERNIEKQETTRQMIQQGSAHEIGAGSYRNMSILFERAESFCRAGNYLAATHLFETILSEGDQLRRLFSLPALMAAKGMANCLIAQNKKSDAIALLSNYQYGFMMWAYSLEDIQPTSMLQQEWQEAIGLYRGLVLSLAIEPDASELARETAANVILRSKSGGFLERQVVEHIFQNNSHLEERKNAMEASKRQIADAFARGSALDAFWGLLQKEKIEQALMTESSDYLSYAALRAANYQEVGAVIPDKSAIMMMQSVFSTGPNTMVAYILPSKEKTPILRLVPAGDDKMLLSRALEQFRPDIEGLETLLIAPDGPLKNWHKQRLEDAPSVPAWAQKIDIKPISSGRDYMMFLLNEMLEEDKNLITPSNKQKTK